MIHERKPRLSASFDSQAITWEPTNLSLREITSMPIQVR